MHVLPLRVRTFLLIIRGGGQISEQQYLVCDAKGAVQIIVFGVLFFILIKGHWRTNNRRQQIGFALFSLSFSVFFVLGHHIQITGDTYTGSYYDNYIDPYSFMDIVAFIFIAIAIYLISSSAFRLILNRTNRSVKFPNLEVISRKKVLICASALFLLWIPYFLSYWPGLIFSDSLRSLEQVLGLSAWKNHHPVAYTALIGLCIEVGKSVGFTVGGGIALYTAIQMSFMSLALSYISNWITTRARLSTPWLVALIAMFGCLAYFATYSIALWKDPLFSCAIAILSLRLFDFVWNGFKVNLLWVVSVCVLILIASLLRNNGIIISGILFISFCLYAIAKRKDNLLCLIPAGSLLITTVLVLIITGPFYSILGILPSPKVESLAIPLNQMARVVVAEGDMSEEDASYMSALLEDGDYALTYSPTSVDSFKWNGHFNPQQLDGGFFGHWFSMFIRNPIVYFEAWEFETCGWWAVNLPQINALGNVSYGDPRNITDSGIAELETHGINARNLLGLEKTEDLFILDGWFIPISWISWFLVFYVFCLFALGKKDEFIGLIPSIGIMLTFLVASPIWYWQRYGLTLDILLPVFIMLFVNLARNESDGITSRFKERNSFIEIN